MMDWTDRHCRYFHRMLTTRALLYTEMVVADAILHGDRQRLLSFDKAEHPLAVQLGGSDPEKLAKAARVAEQFGYGAIRAIKRKRNNYLIGWGLRHRFQRG